MAKIAIVMGSKSDFEYVKPSGDILDRFGIAYDMRVMSAHRTPIAVAEFARDAMKNGYGVIIAAAGKAAHLAGVIASQTLLPVIGIPMKSSTLDGLDSLLSTVQMPDGIPVATVAINGATNAALLAVQILAGSDPTLFEKLKAFRQEAAEKVTAADLSLQ